jgi:hypothetical protein
MFGSIPGLYPPDANSSPHPSCDHEKYPQTLPEVPLKGVARLYPMERCCSSKEDKWDLPPSTGQETNKPLTWKGLQEALAFIFTVITTVTLLNLPLLPSFLHRKKIPFPILQLQKIMEHLCIVFLCRKLYFKSYTLGIREIIICLRDILCTRGSDETKNLDLGQESVLPYDRLISPTDTDLRSHQQRGRYLTCRTLKGCYLKYFEEQNLTQYFLAPLQSLLLLFYLMKQI